MNDEQYRWLCENRRFQRMRGLGEAGRYRERAQVCSGRSPLAVVVARAARQLRQRERVVAAWERVASPQWLADAGVEAVTENNGGGCRVTIAATSSAVCYELCRAKGTITRRLAQLVPGVRDVTFVVADRGPTV